MKTNLKKSLLLILASLSFTSILAQHSINGKIADNQKSPLPFANVILISEKENSTPKGVVSDNNGNYCSC